MIPLSKANPSWQRPLISRPTNLGKSESCLAFLYSSPFTYVRDLKEIDRMRLGIIQSAGHEEGSEFHTISDGRCYV